MKDTLVELEEAIGALMQNPHSYNQTLIGIMARAVGEIERLRKANSDMGWQLNPDRMGGQFTEEEKNRSGWL